MVDKVIFSGQCINNTLLLRHYTTMSKAFTSIYGIKFPELYLNSTTKINGEWMMNMTENNKCFALFEPDRMCAVQTSKDITKLVDLHLIRTEEIRNLAQRISKQICNGDVYMAIHWRNLTGESCAAPNGKCRNLLMMKNISKTADSLVVDIRKFMTERQIRCIYVAFPPFAKEIVKKLKNAHVTNIVTREDISRKNYPIKIREEIRLDNYYLALLEQEICIRANVFFSSEHSGLSRMVVNYGRLDNHTFETKPLRKIASWVAPGVSLRKR